MAAVFAYRSPTQRAELLSLLADHGEQARVLAGGTDLLIDMRNGVAHPEVVVNLKNVEGFSAMSWSDTEGLDHPPRRHGQRRALRRPDS